MGNETLRSRRLCPRACLIVSPRFPDCRRWRGTSIALRPDRYAPVIEWLLPGDVLGRSGRHDPPAVHAGARAHVDDVVGGADGLLVVLDDQHAVPQVAQLDERVQQARVVALVQPDRRLVQDVEHPHQRAADLRRQPDALRFAARQRRGRAIQRQVVDADVVQERQAVARLAQDPTGDLLLLGRQREPLQEIVRLADRQRRHLGDALAADLDEARFLAQPRAAAGFADGVRHVAVELVVDGLEVLFGRSTLLAPPPLVILEAPLQIGQHAFELALEAVLAPVLLERQVDFRPGQALQQQLALLFRQLVPRRVLVDLELRADRVQDLVEEDVVAPLPRLDGPLFDRQLFVGDDEVGVEEHLGADAVAVGAGAGRVVEREQPRRDLGVADAAGRAGELLAEQQVVAPQRRHLDDPFGQLGRQLDRVGQPLPDAVLLDQPIDEHLDRVRRRSSTARAARPARAGRRRCWRARSRPGAACSEARAKSPFFSRTTGRQHGEALPLGEIHDPVDHLLDGLRFDPLAAVPAMNGPDARPQAGAGSRRSRWPSRPSTAGCATRSSARSRWPATAPRSNRRRACASGPGTAARRRTATRRSAAALRRRSCRRPATTCPTPRAP